MKKLLAITLLLTLGAELQAAEASGVQAPSPVVLKKKERARNFERVTFYNKTGSKDVEVYSFNPDFKYRTRYRTPEEFSVIIEDDVVFNMKAPIKQRLIFTVENLDTKNYKKFDIVLDDSGKLAVKPDIQQSEEKKKSAETTASWTSTHTMVSDYLSEPTKGHIEAATRTVAYMKPNLTARNDQGKTLWDIAQETDALFMINDTFPNEWAAFLKVIKP